MDVLIQILAGAGGVSSIYVIARLGLSAWRWFDAARKAPRQRVQDQLDEFRAALDRLTAELSERPTDPTAPVIDQAKGDL